MRDVLRDARRSFPFIERIFADAGYQGPKAAKTVADTGRWVIEIVKRSDAHNFVVLPKRWIVERTLAWILQDPRNHSALLLLASTIPYVAANPYLAWWRQLTADVVIAGDDIVENHLNEVSRCAGFLMMDGGDALYDFDLLGRRQPPSSNRTSVGWHLILHCKHAVAVAPRGLTFPSLRLAPCILPPRRGRWCSREANQCGRRCPSPPP
jgi:transposase